MNTIEHYEFVIQHYEDKENEIRAMLGVSPAADIVEVVRALYELGPTKFKNRYRRFRWSKEGVEELS